MKIKKLSVILSILLLLVINTASCGNESDTIRPEYVRAICQVQGIKFSLEYPKSFKYLYPDRSTWASPSMETDFFLVDSDPQDSTNYNTYFLVRFFDPTIHINENNEKIDAHGTVSRFIASGLGLDPSYQFKVLKQTTIKVDENPGEMIISQMVEPPNSQIPNKLTVRHAAYFNHNSTVSYIDLTTTVDFSKQAEIEFEHIVNSFKFVK